MKVGVIGLGAMGAYMALNFHKAGYLHRIWNRSQDKAEAVAAKTDAGIAVDAESLAAECDLVLTCVSRDNDVLEMIQQIARGIKPGSVVVDTSTVSSDTANQAAALLSEKAAAFLDCPVSGGVEGAKNATLAMMVGGDETVLECVREPLAAIAKNIVYIGPTGSGQACKAVNQIMAAGLNQAVTDALAFGQAMGLNMDRVIDVVSTGAAGNWFLSHRGKTMLADRYEPGFKLGLHHKDLTICRSMLQKITEASLPTLEMTLGHYQRLIDEGYGDEDISALFRLKKKLLQT
ncbi:MAG: NAD(P)-dependent oxidoreductase [Gammaproteobacteria bacterium]|nr:prephenate dehydrogenase/arogenate dehydrogenase family protein [Gammaproteobacteria bacterium]NIO61638.1 prephenate dehydrogenase/arogenate dehydrogenase family protein [Gammaproteobacteria bacterium]NIP49165.1 NAD(P)-dependent oxidoreductase [Gammaproteobacteria bacterium]NIQ09945.1 NAD(P)-dependent oxidoreductase [Gammaproteobacteria bacterium]NIQ18889.1 prephenate dehydrogenase/arogenate dehydrogenase family protein [Gammaproteobacteria bacterium]